VAGVSDGDTLTVLAAGNVQYRIRLWGVDAPETSQFPFRRDEGVPRVVRRVKFVPSARS
jgi:endonuclease YncB( thermonuclease family)